MQNEVNADLRKKIKLTEQKITLEVSNVSKAFDSKIEMEAEKINAVVQSKRVGLGWTLNKKEFIVACLGASGANVEIGADGLTVNNGKFLLKDNGDIVFKVNTDGVCNAVGGFVVKDGDTSCEISKDGITLTNSKGYTSRLYVKDGETALQFKDDLYIGKGIFLTGLSYFKTNVDIGGILTVGGKSLQTIIDARINALK